MLALVTGGSGSGKSAWAEDLVLSLGEGRRIYIATMYPFDEESHRRIERHRKMRAGKGFETVECYTGLASLEIGEDSVVLLECMSNLTANEMFQENGAGAHTVSAVLKGVEHLRKKARHVVIVTNEIFSDAFPYEAETVRYQEYLGKINQEIGAVADLVTEVVYGIPVYHKDQRGRESEKVDIVS